MEISTLAIINNFELDAQGLSSTGKQGLAASDFNQPLNLTVNGVIKNLIGQLATAGVAVLYDDTVDLPASFAYLYLWADQTIYVQLIGTGSNVVLKLTATVPFTLSLNSILAAANTSLITGGAEPPVTDLKKIVIGNYSGQTVNYRAAIID